MPEKAIAVAVAADGRDKADCDGGGDGPHQSVGESHHQSDGQQLRVACHQPGHEVTDDQHSEDGQQQVSAVHAMCPLCGGRSRQPGDHAVHRDGQTRGAAGDA